MKGNSEKLLLVYLCLNTLLLVSNSLADGYEQAAVLQGSQTVSSGNINNTETAQAIEWTTSSFDPVLFAHSPSAAAHQLTILQAGDYLVSTTVPMNSTVQRSCIRLELYVNGSPVPGSIGESSYIRSAGSPAHNHSSSHSAVLVPGLTAGDVLEARLIGTAYSGTTTITDTATMLVEYIDSNDRDVFAAATTRTVAGTNINSDSSYQWTSYRSDEPYQHDQSVDSDQIVIREPGIYLLTVNIPQQSSVQRANASLEIELNGAPVPAGEARQGYIRSYSGHNNSSIHWSGLIRTSTPDSVLRINSWREAASGTVVIPSGSEGSLYLEQLAAEDVFLARGVSTTAGSNWNQTTAAHLQFSTQDLINTELFEHSETVDSHQVRVLQDGYYIALFQSGVYSASARANPGAAIEVNSSALPGAEVKTHYIRAASGHNESSGSLFFPLGELSSGDTISLSVQRRGSNGTVTANQDALFAIVKRPDRTPPPQPVLLSPADGSILNEASISIAGTGEPQAGIEVFSDVEGSLGTTTVDAGGSWVLAASAPLSDGAHQLTASAEDSAGNVSQLSTSIVVLIDTISPAVPLVLTPASGYTNLAEVQFSGSAEAGSRIELYDETQLVDTAVVDAGGEWQLTTAVLPDGAYQFQARAVDAAGNTSEFSSGLSLEIDTAAPDAPILLSPINGTVVGLENPVFNGLAEAGVLVDILLDSAILASVTAGSGGTWTYSHPGRLSEGLHSVSARARDQAQNTSILAPSAAIQVLGLRTIEGLIQLDGTPVENVAVNAGSLGSYVTDSAGRFEISNVVVGTAYSIVPELAGFQFSPAAAAGTVAADISHIFQAAYQRFSISGRVVDEGGSGLSGVLINGGGIGTTITDNQGSYSFQNVLYGTAYSLSASKYGYSFDTVVPTSTIESDVVIPIQAAANSYSITGRLLQNNIPVSGARIDGGPLGTRYSNSEGYFRFDAVPYGSDYSLTPSYLDLVFVPSSISGSISGSVEHQFTAELGFSLSGRVLHQNKPVEGARVTMYAEAEHDASRVRLLETSDFRETSTDNDGRYSFAGVLPGSYMITADKNGVTLDSNNHQILIPETVGSNGGTTEVHADLEVGAVRLENPVFVLWNGYLDMANILELSNKGAADLRASVSLYSMGGAPAQPPIETFSVSIPAEQQRDVILNDLPGFRSDSYGMAKIEFSEPDFDGRMMMYRPSRQGSGFEFVLSTPFANLSSGSTNLLANTFYPSRLSPPAAHTTANWLSIANPNSRAMSFNVHYFDQHGSEAHAVRISIPSMGRIDIDGGHGVFGADRTGQIEIRPDDFRAPYLASMSRFGRDAAAEQYSLAVSSTAMRPNNAVQYLPLTNLDHLLNIVEITNCSENAAAVDLLVRDTDGLAVDSFSLSLKPRATTHLPAHALLQHRSAGILKLDPLGNAAVRIKGLEYTFDSDGKLQHALSADSHEPFASELYGSFNLFLGMANWLRLVNVSGEPQSLNITMNTQWGSISRRVELGAYARLDLPLHDDRRYSLDADTYGVFSVTGAASGSCLAHLVRQGFSGPDTDFSVLTSVR